MPYCLLLRCLSGYPSPLLLSTMLPTPASWWRKIVATGDLELRERLRRYMQSLGDKVLDKSSKLQGTLSR